MGKTDHPSLGTTTVFDERTVRQGPTQGFMTACLDGDDIGRDRTDRQRCCDAGDDIFGRNRPVQKENVDQGAGAAGIPISLSCGRPERFVS